MTSAFRYETLLRRTSLAGVAMAMVIGLSLFSSILRMAGADAATGDRAPRESSWPKVVTLTQADWSVFKASGGAVPVKSSEGSLSRRYRLAGTFFWSSSPENQTVRKAILDDLDKKTEHIVAIGDVLDNGANVDNILQNTILLSLNGRQEELTLSYAGGGLIAEGAVETELPDWLKLEDGESVISTNQYGAKIGETRWIMNRSRLEHYASEIEDHPARMVPLFDSMKPMYEYYDNGRRRVTGYNLKIEGEREFYESMGFNEGDVIKRVNDMPMTSKGRAMFWINSFRDDAANSFMMDIERDGKDVRLEYLVR